MHYSTMSGFQLYLDSKIPPKWLRAIILHHTYTPQVHQWNGEKTFNAIKRHYELTLGWVSYPHIFVAPDGNWIMNDVTKFGTASNVANSFSIAVEVVGRYDDYVWQEPIKTYAVETLAALVKWGKLSVYNIMPHRMFNTAKSCPGHAIIMQDIYNLVNKEIAKKVYRVNVDVANIRQGPSTSYGIAGKINRGEVFTSYAKKTDENKTINTTTGRIYTWNHISEHPTLANLGFIRDDLTIEL